MKKSTLAFLVAFFTLTATFSFAQQTHQQTYDKSEVQQVDTRIDNMGYWKRCADAGLVTVAPFTPTRNAKFTGSEINSKMVRDEDSVDTPVTEKFKCKKFNEMLRQDNFSGFNFVTHVFCPINKNDFKFCCIPLVGC